MKNLQLNVGDEIESIEEGHRWKIIGRGTWGKYRGRCIAVGNDTPYVLGQSSDWNGTPSAWRVYRKSCKFNQLYQKLL